MEFGKVDADDAQAGSLGGARALRGSHLGGDDVGLGVGEGELGVGVGEGEGGGGEDLAGQEEGK